jgi:adenylate kinase
MLQLIKQTLSTDELATKGWILDGFPRTLPQAQQLQELLQTLAQPLSAVFYLKVPEQVIFDRIKGTLAFHPFCNRIDVSVQTE